MDESRQRKVFSENLIRILHEKGKSQKEAADAINVSPQTFNTWCRGIALPRMGKLQILADYLYIDKSDLLDPPDTAAPSDLSPDEREVLEAYRQLDPQGKNMTRRMLGLKEDGGSASEERGAV